MSIIEILLQFIWLTFCGFHMQIRTRFLAIYCLDCVSFAMVFNLSAFGPVQNLKFNLVMRLIWAFKLLVKGWTGRMNWLNSAAYVEPQKRAGSGEWGLRFWLIIASFLESKPFAIHFVSCRTVLTCPILSCPLLLIDGQRSNTCRFEYFKIIKRAIQQLVSFRFQFTVATCRCC